MAITLPAPVLEEYARFSLYNSPYPAHDEGCAVDLYPGVPGKGDGPGGRTTAAPSPVSGTVQVVERVRAPSKQYAHPHDYLLVLECDGPAALAGYLVRILHVEPSVGVGDAVERGDSLGRLVRSGYFAPWVDNHLHVGVRRPDQDPLRASGSLPLAVGVDLEGVPWDGTGTVVETGDAYAVLDSPSHPDPGESFVGVRADGGGVLDGGCPHYDGGGLFERASGPFEGAGGPVALSGDRLGVADRRTVAWDPITVTANGRPATGLSLFLARDEGFGAKLVGRDLDLMVGDRVAVEVVLDATGGRPTGSGGT